MRDVTKYEAGFSTGAPKGVSCRILATYLVASRANFAERGTKMPYEPLSMQSRRRCHEE